MELATRAAERFHFNKTPVESAVWPSQSLSEPNFGDSMLTPDQQNISRLRERISETLNLASWESGWRQGAGKHGQRFQAACPILERATQGWVQYLQPVS